MDVCVSFHPGSADINCPQADQWGPRNQVLVCAIDIERHTQFHWRFPTKSHDAMMQHFSVEPKNIPFSGSSSTSHGHGKALHRSACPLDKQTSVESEISLLFTYPTKGLKTWKGFGLTIPFVCSYQAPNAHASTATLILHILFSAEGLSSMTV